VPVAKEKAEEILKCVGLYHRKDVPGDDLNLPELKRMELAKALATEPEVLLLDEVMAGLNPTECSKVVELIKKIRESGISLIVIEHVMKAVMSLSERIYVLNQGKLIAEGTPEEITYNSEVIKSYLGEKKYA
jgi:branched-chain amino acid transport system ATP-binding protein